MGSDPWSGAIQLLLAAAVAMFVRWLTRMDPPSRRRGKHTRKDAEDDEDE